MIKVGPSPSILEPENPATEQPKKPIPLTAIPITLAIGLVVALGYVGIRVMAPSAHATTIVLPKPAADHSLANAEVPQPVTADVAPSAVIAPAPVVHSVSAAATADVRPGLVARAQESPVPTPPSDPLDAPQASPSQASAAEKNLDLIAPRPGERYLQIAAIAASMVPSFLADLKKYNVRASVAPGPHDGLVRIVIGPFADRDSAARAKDQIQTKWTDCFVRLY